MKGKYIMDPLWFIVIVLLISSTVFLALSYFNAGKGTSEQQSDFEEVSLDLFQEIAQLRGRLNEIDVALDLKTPEHPTRSTINKTTENQIIKLFTRGQSEEEIANNLNISVEVVMYTVNQYINDGLA